MYQANNPIERRCKPLNSITEGGYAIKRKINLGAVSDDIDTIELLLTSYPSIDDMPADIQREILRLSNEAAAKLRGVPVMEQAPNLSVFNGKSPYFANPELRYMEIQSAAGSLGARSQESAYSFIVERLRSAVLNPSGMRLEDKVNLLLELELERLLQAPQAVDTRNLGIVRDAYRVAVDRWRQETYRSMISADWQQVLARYEEGEGFYLNCGNYLVYPIVLDVMSKEPDKRFGIKPLHDLGVCGVFNLEDEALCRETEKQNNANPFVRISVSHMHRFRWELLCYNRSAEELLASFKGMINQRLAAFERTHGSLTPTLTLSATDMPVHMTGGDELLLGWRIVMREKQEESPKRKLLGRLLDIG